MVEKEKRYKEKERLGKSSLRLLTGFMPLIID